MRIGAACPASPPHVTGYARAMPRSGCRRLVLGAAALLRAPAPRRMAQPRHAIAMHGEPALPAGFTHFPYVNPAAPKGGRAVQGVLGSFDSLNPFIIKGLPPQGLRAPLVSGANVIAGYVVESLMVRSFDEPFTLYGLLAETVETDAARSYVTFTLNPAARFSDGKPVTARGRRVLVAAAARQGPAEPPHLLFQGRQGRDHRRAHGALRSCRRRRSRIAADPRPDAGAGTARDQSGDVRGNLDDAAARQRTLSWSAASIRARASRSRAIRDYWGRDLAVNRGFWNFDEIRFDYYRDANVLSRGVQEGPVRPAQGERSGPLADRPTISPRCATAASSRRASPRACRSRASPSCSTRAARSLPTSACARRSRCCSISNG